jgi:uncharacterized protein YebE (UPF0316 family)
MNFNAFLDSTLFTWLILPFLIFLARICDVTIGTIRIIVVSKGKKLLASCLGFFEVLIWIIAISQIMKHLNTPTCYIGYALGFALGNFIGITVEEKLAMGTLVVKIFANGYAVDLMNSLKNAGCGVTCLEGHGTTGPVNVIHTVIKRSLLPEVEQIIKQFNPRAFYAIEEVRSVNAGIFPAKNHAVKRKIIQDRYKRSKTKT